MTRKEDFPSTWVQFKISEIAIVNPTLAKSEIPEDLDVSFVPMPAVQAESGFIDVSNKRKFSDVKKGYTPFREGDVLFAKITPCMENGKMAVVPALRNDLGFGSTEFHVLRILSGVNVRYIYYYVSSKTFRREAEHNMSGAVGQRRVTTPYLAGCEIPIPPTNEQHRIVAKIEALFSELDKGMESFKTAREQLKIYRQALLKHAFSGKLTEQWRTERRGGSGSRDNIPSRDIIPNEGEILLQHIQTEREQRKRPAIPPVKNSRPAAFCDFLSRSRYGHQIEMASAYRSVATQVVCRKPGIALSSNSMVVRLQRD